MDILILSAGADEVIILSSPSSPPVLGLGEVVLTPSLPTLGEALGTGAGDGEELTSSLSTLGEALGTGTGDGKRRNSVCHHQSHRPLRYLKSQAHIVYSHYSSRARLRRTEAAHTRRRT